MNRFQPDGWHTITPRIITPTPREMVDFVKHVFDGQGDFHRSRPSEIRVGDSLIMISDGNGLRPEALAREQLIQHHAPGPNVGALIDLLALDYANPRASVSLHG